MNALQAVLLVAASLSVGQSLDYLALNQFRKMILCVMPDSSPIFDYAELRLLLRIRRLRHTRGRSGQCYSDAMQHPECWPILDNPYTKLYDYTCDEANRKVTCGSSNNECEMFICECDRKAAECFGRSEWNPEHEHLPSENYVWTHGATAPAAGLNEMCPATRQSTLI
ncbi:unnamed protein product [Tetraodon nigroviridis]|uniref:(spotted green pufferfish) hypothetical protein n=1 Tax=Tetraodon nigroviridis TaxID=99883 RepID=Q4SE94_TETNG|nr:unnamed protein product [Tetraodon nigroviridis]